MADRSGLALVPAPRGGVADSPAHRGAALLGALARRALPVERYVDQLRGMAIVTAALERAVAASADPFVAAARTGLVPRLAPLLDDLAFFDRRGPLPDDPGPVCGVRVRPGDRPYRRGGTRAAPRGPLRVGGDGDGRPRPPRGRPGLRGRGGRRFLVRGARRGDRAGVPGVPRAPRRPLHRGGRRPRRGSPWTHRRRGRRGRRGLRAIPRRSRSGTAPGAAPARGNPQRRGRLPRRCLRPRGGRGLRAGR